MAAPQPRALKNFEIKQKLLRPALTSHFQCWFNPPSAVRTHVAEKGINYNANGELLSIYCSDASLPGSSLATNEINDDFTGITERFAYRRTYDDRVDFTFYVDHNVTGNTSYNIILFFEEWMRYAMNETSTEPNKEYFYRVRFPDGLTGNNGYRSPAVYLNKFERDFAGDYLQYSFLDAYPISVNSIPVSYESSQLLKSTVSFTYTRYLVSRNKNKISRREYESALDAGIGAAYGYQLGSEITRDLLTTVNKSSGGNSPISQIPSSTNTQQQIRTQNLF
jgi:hypothetical protein